MSSNPPEGFDAVSYRRFKATMDEMDDAFMQDVVRNADAYAQLPHVVAEYKRELRRRGATVPEVRP